MKEARRPLFGLLAVLILILLAGTGCPLAPDALPESRSADPHLFSGNPLWDDGRAEISAYDAIMPRYGTPRPFTAYHIVVKEDFSRSQLVKADPGHDPDDLLPVLKMNQVFEYQTGIYPYRQMLSTFHARADMTLLKLTLASFEWCGNSYKEFTRRNGRGTLHVHTYWDGQADATYPVPAGPDVVFYDELPLWVRSLPQTSGTTRTLRMMSGQVSSRGPTPEIRSARLNAAAREKLTIPAGTFDALRWELTVEDEDADRLWTGVDFPFPLLAWERSDGASFRLEWTDRLAYWTLNRPGDERYLRGEPARHP
jgi:hypothetical protein